MHHRRSFRTFRHTNAETQDTQTHTHIHIHTHTIARIAVEHEESYRDVNFEVFQQRPQSAAYTCQYSHACMQSAMQKRETVGDVEGALNQGKAHTHSKRHMVDTCCDASSLRSCLASESCETGHQFQMAHLHSLVPRRQVKVRQCQ